MMGFAISISTSLGTGTGPGVNTYFFTINFSLIRVIKVKEATNLPYIGWKSNFDNSSGCGYYIFYFKRKFLMNEEARYDIKELKIRIKSIGDSL